MEEREQALAIANQWLDFKMNSLVQMVHGDPDCDACVLARQYVHECERDNPELDATDGAHPAWWRGYDYGSTQWRLMAEDTLIQVAQLLDDWAQGGTFSGYGGKIRGQVSLLMQALAGIRVEKELAANGDVLKAAG